MQLSHAGKSARHLFADNNNVREIHTMIPKKHKTATMDTVLHHLRLPQYKSAFQKHHVDLYSFLRINDQTLRTIGVHNESHRQLLLVCGRKMREVVCQTIAVDSLETCDAPSTAASDNSPAISISEDEKPHPWDDQELFERVIANGGLERQPLTPITEEPNASADLGQPPPYTASQELSDLAAEQAKSHDRKFRGRRGSTLNSVRSIASIDEEPDASLLGAPAAAATAAAASTSATTSSPKPRPRRSLDEFSIVRKRQQRAAERDPNWRSSMPVISQSILRDMDGTAPPSYNDAIISKVLAPKPLDDNETGKEELPSYSCTVFKCGYVLRKCEKTSHNTKARDRSWRRNYLYLAGTLLRVYKSEPVDVKRISPSYELSMRNARVALAIDYTKRRYVLRVTFGTGHQFLFQANNRDDCVRWIETLQSSANISTVIDEREMPQFVMLSTRRRRMMYGTGYFADLARDLQELPPDQQITMDRLAW